MLDETVSFRHHISYVCTRISRKNGILTKLRHFLTLSQMKQLYYSIIFPYISYAILAWGSAYKTHINKVQTKQNHSIRLIFFARTFGEQTDSALPLLNLLDVLTVNNIYKFQTLIFTHHCHKGILPKLVQDICLVTKRKIRFPSLGSFDAPWSEWSSINLFSNETQNPFSDFGIQSWIFLKKRTLFYVKSLRDHVKSLGA